MLDLILVLVLALPWLLVLELALGLVLGAELVLEPELVLVLGPELVFPSLPATGRPDLIPHNLCSPGTI